MSAHFIAFYTQKPVHEHDATMQIKVRIASWEPNNISLTIFDAKEYHEHNLSFIWTKDYHFRKHSNPEISDLLPRMCHETTLGLQISSQSFFSSHSSQIKLVIKFYVKL